MTRRSKKIREKGKLRLSSYFKNISDGVRVSVVRERGIAASFPERIQGMAGSVFCSRGKFKEIKIKDVEN